MSHKFDADITAPYGAIKIQHEYLSKHYSEIFEKKKTKNGGMDS